MCVCVCVCAVKITAITATAPCGENEGEMGRWPCHVAEVEAVREGGGWQGGGWRRRCDVGQEGQERTYPCRPLLLFSC